MVSIVVAALFGGSTAHASRLHCTGEADFRIDTGTGEFSSLWFHYDSDRVAVKVKDYTYEFVLTYKKQPPVNIKIDRETGRFTADSPGGGAGTVPWSVSGTCEVATEPRL